MPLYSAGNAHLEAAGCTALMPALGMQAERQEKEASSEDGAPPIEAAGLRSNAGEFVVHIHLTAVAV